MDEDDIYDRLLTDTVLGDADPLETAMPSGRALRMRAKIRMTQALKQEHLAAILPQAPSDGESVHVVSNAKHDFATWIPHMLSWCTGPADFLYCSTWTLSRSNAEEIFALHDAGLIAPGQLHFLTGLYFKRRESATYNFLLSGLTTRSGRFRAFENHCKVLLLSCPSAGLHLTVEGSANLNANPRFEQYVLTNDAALLSFHRRWMDETFTSPPKQYRSTTMKGETAVHRGYAVHRAGPGVTAATNDHASRQRLAAAKLDVPILILDTITRQAYDLAELIRTWLPTPPPPTIITVPPQGSTWPGPHYAEALARAVAARLGLPFAETLHRLPGPEGSEETLDFRPPFPDVAAVILIDDLITTGATMKRSLAAISEAGPIATAFAYNGA